jgi:Rad3-related DNA helicase
MKKLPDFSLLLPSVFSINFWEAVHGTVTTGGTLQTRDAILKIMNGELMQPIKKVFFGEPYILN